MKHRTFFSKVEMTMMGKKKKLVEQEKYKRAKPDLVSKNLEELERPREGVL